MQKWENANPAIGHLANHSDLSGSSRIKINATLHLHVAQRGEDSVFRHGRNADVQTILHQRSVVL